MIYKINSFLLGVPFALTYAISAVRKRKTVKTYGINDIYPGSFIAFIAIMGVLFFSLVFTWVIIIIS